MKFERILRILMFELVFQFSDLMNFPSVPSSLPSCLSPGSSRCRKATSFTSIGRLMPTGLKENIMDELVFSPHPMSRWISSFWSCFFFSELLLYCLLYNISLSQISLQILPPTEKPTPIKSPTLQVLDYGEAVALFNFNADLPVELSFRKVSIAVELQQEGGCLWMFKLECMKM